MSDRVTYLPGVRKVSACLPTHAKKDEDGFSVVLSNTFLKGIGGEVGNRVTISRLELPEHGQPGAISSRGRIYVGFLYFPETGGLILSGADRSDGEVFFEAGSYERLGVVDRICKSCARGECFPIPRAHTAPLSVDVVGMLRWKTDARGCPSDDVERHTWATMFGCPPDECAGSGWAKFVHPEDREAFLVRWIESLETGRAYINRGRFRIAGVWRDVVVSANAVRDESGSVIGWDGVIQLVAAAKKRA